MLKAGLTPEIVIAKISPLPVSSTHRLLLLRN